MLTLLGAAPVLDPVRWSQALQGIPRDMRIGVQILLGLLIVAWGVRGWFARRKD